MPPATLPAPTLTLSSREARRFLLAHHHLLPPRRLAGKAGVLALFERLGCIQFDTISVVGRNADLVLQARVKNYRPNLLEELLYQDRELIDGWDKVASIYPSKDWPNFARRRRQRREYLPSRSEEAAQAAPRLLEAIREDGPKSSLDFKTESKTDWFWAPTSIARAALEGLYMTGQLGIHHRVNTRRIFDLTERLIPPVIFNQPDPHTTDQDYQDWHTLRRVGGLGIASPSSGEHWLGILGGEKVRERNTILARLVENRDLLPITVEGLDGQTLFIRQSDWDRWETQKGKSLKPQASLIAPLDNLIWNRKLIAALFGFDYVWEVYKPKSKREYGYYVLPVLYGDRFIARLDAKLDRKSNSLTIKNLWWEEGVEHNETMLAALARCLEAFRAFTGAAEITLGEPIAKDRLIRSMID